MERRVFRAWVKSALLWGGRLEELSKEEGWGTEMVFWVDIDHGCVGIDGAGGDLKGPVGGSSKGNTSSN